MSTQEITRITLKNAQNMQVELCDFGARILSIQVPNPEGKLIETTLNHASNDDILADTAYMGATCGRVANRISGARFEVKGQEYLLEANEGENILHGGSSSFSHRFWQISEQTKTTVTFALLSPAGDQGFPGNLQAHVRYALLDDNTLRIEYTAKSDALCPMNMCNHAYFTLGESSIHDLTLNMYASSYLPINSHSIPTGELHPVNDAFNFQTPAKLSDKLAIRDFDDCYVVDAPCSVILSSSKNNIQLRIESDHVGMQVYTGNYLPTKHSAIALEAQGLIDAVNQRAFETEWVGPGQDYHKYVAYQFAHI